MLSWIKRRTLSRYADDKAVHNFARVTVQTGMSDDLDMRAVAEFLESGKEPTPEELEWLARQLGQYG